MKTAHSREVFFLDIEIDASPGDAPRKTMGEFAEIAEALKLVRRGVQKSRDDVRKLRLVDVEHDQDRHMLWLLLYATNRRGSDAAYADMETDAHRTAGKQEGEGRGEAAHLLISTASDRNRYLALFEGCPDISRGRLQAFLRLLFRLGRKHSPDKFMRPAPTGERLRNGSPKMEPFSNSVSIFGHLSEILREHIEGGKLYGISLETEDADHLGFGEERGIRPVLKNVKLKVDQGIRGDAVSIVRRVLRLGRANNYERARISFKEEDDRSAHTALLDTENGMVLNEGFIKKETIEFPNVSIPDGFDSFQEPIRNEMRRLLTEYEEKRPGADNAPLPTP